MVTGPRAMLMTRVAACYEAEEDPPFGVLRAMVATRGGVAGAEWAGGTGTNKIGVEGDGGGAGGGGGGGEGGEGGDEDSLADLIEADGRQRLERGLGVSLERYMGAVAGLEGMPAALDAAIDMTLRSMSGSSRPEGAAVDALAAKYPRLERAIREAAQLNGALWSTAAVKGAVTGRPVLELPCELGPPHGGRARYELRSLLGGGTGGDVYLAVDRKLSEADHEALVAVKVLSGSRREDESVFFEEATKARRVVHPNVVRIEDCGVSAGGERYIVYEHLAGGDLQQYVERRGGRMPAREAAGLVERICRGVHGAHRAGLIHCDLKPGNVLLDEAGEPKVADFGVAQRHGGSAGARRGPVGNYAFMSPEQYRGEAGAITTACDVYALGGLLYCLITGRLPNGQTPEEVEERLREAREAPGLTGVDGDLAAICRRALAARPEARHESAAALAEDLARWRSRLPITWRNPGVRRRVGLWARRRPAVAGLTGLMLVVVVAGSVTGAYLNSVAQQRRIALLEAEAEAAAAAVKASYMEIRRDVDEVLDIAKAVEELRDLPIPRELDILTESFYVEAMFGPKLLHDPVRLRRLFLERRQIARGVVEAEEAAGRGGEYKAMTWRVIAGFWELLDGDPALAARMFEESRRRWGEVLSAEDSMLVVLEAMGRASALAALLESAPVGTPPTEELKSRVAALAEEVWRDERRLAERVGRGQFHLAVVHTLQYASTKRWTEDRAKRGRVAELLDEYGEHGVLHYRPRG